MHITSKRLSMRQITATDWALFERLHTDPEVIKQCFDLPSDTDIREKFESRLPVWSVTSGDWLCLVITDKETGDDIGITGFYYDGKAAEVGYLIQPQFAGKGYGTESLMALVSWSARTLSIGHYQAIVTAGNAASERVLEKSGFQLSHVDPDAYSIGGKLYADHVFKLNIS